MTAEYYQNLLLEKSKRVYSTLSEEVINAFKRNPRHQYVPIYRNSWDTKWIHVDSSNLEENLETLYSDNPLCIYDNPSNQGQNNFHSTISQPSFVLKMIDMLNLKAGHKVFELGTGSGWNAALMGTIVGPTGKIISLEIIPELVDRAKKSLEENNITNVSVINSDAGDGWAIDAPYDRAIFTAGAEDLPKCFFDQIKDGGLLLFVLKNKSGGDQLFLLEKTAGHFKSLQTFMCSFVPVTGKYGMKDQHTTPLPIFLSKNGIPNIIIHEKKFSWSEMKRIDSFREIEALNFFLSICVPEISILELEDGQIACGFYDKPSHSLAVIQEESIVSYGNSKALKKFMSELHTWVEAGMPESDKLNLEIHPAHIKIPSAPGQWVIHHQDSVFVWSSPHILTKSIKQSDSAKTF